MAGKKKKIITHKNVHICCTQNSNRDLEIIRQGIQLISAILLRMWQDEQAENANTQVDRNSTNNQED
jgi:hypothetical protein